MDAFTVTVGGRQIRVAPTGRGYHRTGWDLFDGDQRLTAGDPLILSWQDGEEAAPALELVESLLHPRKLALMALLGTYRDVCRGDYPDYCDELLALIDQPRQVPGRYAAVYGDETYTFVHTHTDLQDALDHLGSIVGEVYAGLPVAIVDLDTGKKVPFDAILVPRDTTTPVAVQALTKTPVPVYLGPGVLLVSLRIENAYELYPDVVTIVENAVIPAPPAGHASSAFDDWADEYVRVFTGVGHEDGDSWYDVEITACSNSDLVGKTFAWGY
jgi:hypothetical protein